MFCFSCWRHLLRKNLWHYLTLFLSHSRRTVTDIDELINFYCTCFLKTDCSCSHVRVSRLSDASCVATSLQCASAKSLTSRPRAQQMEANASAQGSVHPDHGGLDANAEPPIARFFIFIFFIFVFYKNIFLIWKFTEIYPVRPAAGGPGPARPAAGRQRLICKKKMKKNCR